MAKPVILTVDDEPGVLRAIERDLRKQYSKEYRVIGAGSGQAALETLQQLSVRNEPVALILVDQRMPEMTGVDVLEQVVGDWPTSKRALLTAYADTDAAIQAINAARLDYYIMKPWDPPEDRLYPILDDLLSDWQAGYRPGIDGISVFEHTFSKESHHLKEFLVRNQIPYQAFDVDADEGAAKLAAKTEVDTADLPVLVMPDGERLVRPSTVEVAEKVGLHTHAELDVYDLVIVGAGPAGLAAAVYGSSEGLKTLLVEKDAPGGQAGQSAKIENYLGFPSGLSGADLARRAVTQATRFGAEILVPGEAVALVRKDPYRIVQLSDGSEVNCKAVIISSGVSYRTLDVPGTAELTGSGVYYGVSRMDAMVHEGEPVFVLGGANSAGQGAVYLTRVAEQVTMLIRGESLAASMSQYLIDVLERIENFQLRTRVRMKEVHGNGRVESLLIEDRDTGEEEEVKAGALFIFIGQKPRTDWVADVVERDERGFIFSSTLGSERPDGWYLERAPLPFESTVPGVFVAGDVRADSTKRVASAAGEGAMAVRFVHQHLASF
ncbi:MAG: FAD-dependent oxidoreductase [Acidimicrobiia bacterium]